MTQGELVMPPPEGIHINLPESAYFDAHALGSSDFKILSEDPASWWYASSYNPSRRERKRYANHLNFGSALDTMLLLGEDAFQDGFTIEPDEDSGRWAKTIHEIKALLERHGVSSAGEYDRGKLTALAKRAGCANDIFGLARSAYEGARRKGLAHITQDEERRLRHMVRLIKAHEDLGPGLELGLSQVSVFFRDEEHPEPLQRVRFDKLQDNFILDLKSMGKRERGQSPHAAAVNSIVNFRYDLQFAHYCRTRPLLARFIEAGRVYAYDDGGEPVRPPRSVMKALESIAAETDWQWLWIFYQVRSDDVGKEAAPVIVPLAQEPCGPLFDAAAADVDRALANYREYSAKHGLDKPWSEVFDIAPAPEDELVRRLSYRRTQP